MIQLTPDECRVLGVLVEKAYTTPSQYPLTLNAVQSGSNQKSNRDPHVDFGEEQVYDALEGLRQKGLAREVMMSGSRVQKYRQTAKDALEIDTKGLVIIAELLLRGPQTVGELRGRASRMNRLDSIEVVQQALQLLMDRDEPLVRELRPVPGSRAPRFAQLLCPDLHPIEVRPASSAPAAAASPASDGAMDHELRDRIAALESQVESLRSAVMRMAGEMGMDDLFNNG